MADAWTARAIAGNKIPVPMPPTRLRNIHETVGVLGLSRIRMPKPSVAIAQPMRFAQRYLPVTAMAMPVATDAGATVNVHGNELTPAMIGPMPLTASKYNGM